MHQSNAAEQAICTFKSHFIAILAGVAPYFPRNLWDLLLPQIELTLNLIRQSTLDPSRSAWAYFHGPFNYNATPGGPLGCDIIAQVSCPGLFVCDDVANKGSYWCSVVFERPVEVCPC